MKNNKNDEPPAIADNIYAGLVKQISELYSDGRVGAVSAVNTIMLETYWEIGKYIVEFEQTGNIKAEYGKIKNSSKTNPKDIRD